MLNNLFKKKAKSTIEKWPTEEKLKQALSKQLENPKINKAAKRGFYIVIALIIFLFILRQFQ